MKQRLSKFKKLIEPCSDQELELMAQESRRLTLQYFGKTVRFFAPLYLSNECINQCKYCGFSRGNPILRVTLTPEQVETEARHLLAEGFRNILLVAGEHPKFVGPGYLEECAVRLRRLGIPSIHFEIGPMEVPEYRRLVEAGAEGLVVYQETYDRKVYAEMHVAGPKKDYDWRRQCPLRAYEAGFRRIGVGALFGLADWRQEALDLAIHLDELVVSCWKSFLTVSMPRLRPAAGEFQPLTQMSDRDFVQVLMAFRICFPQVGFVLSTRETPDFRDRLIPLGVTMMSAGSHTEPGGYTGVGQSALHFTSKGTCQTVAQGEHATEQFMIADTRSTHEVAERIRKMGYEPVWKDWDVGLIASAGS